ncbi:MAG: hypothetical protein K2O92_04410 [Lachnospiraceae bacterium]|nr:hypothetical protein [Lachnospiraceae bacterium]
MQIQGGVLITSLKMETVSIIDSIEDFEMMEVVAFLRNFKINNKNAGLVRLAFLLLQL